MSRSKRQRWLACLLTIVIAYFGSYCVLSSLGEQKMMLSGELRYPASMGGLAMPDMSEWQPRGILFHRRRSIDGSMATDWNLLGLVYCPLILIDRTYVHPTTSIEQLK